MYSNKLITKLEMLNEEAIKKVDIEQINRAIYYAKKYHANQKRDSGELFYSHPLAVAEMVSDYLFDTDAIIIAILHDIVEDTDVTVEMVKEWFGDNVAKGVEGLTRVKLYGKITSAEIIELLWRQGDKKTLLIKLCDRLHNMQTISAKSPPQIKKIVEETFKTFLILAIYLKIYTIEEKLSKLCYPYLPTQISQSSDIVRFKEVDSFQVLSLAFQNEKSPNHNQYLSESKLLAIHNFQNI